MYVQALRNGTRILNWSPAALETVAAHLLPAREAARRHLCLALLRPLALFRHLPSTTLEAAASLFEPRYGTGES